MLTGLSIKIFKVQLSLSSLLCAVPYEWDPKAEEVKLASGRKRRLGSRCHNWMMVYLGLLLLNSIKTVFLTKYEGIFLFAVGVLWTALILLTLTFCILSRKKEYELMTLLNSVFELSKADRQHEIPENRMMGHILKFGVILSVSCGPSIGILLWIIPCMPPFPGSLVFNCNPSGFLMPPTGFLHMSMAVIQSLSNVLIWTFAGTMAMFYLYFVFPMTVGITCNHFHAVSQLTNRATTVSPVLIKRVSGKYREIQLITNRLNDCFQTEWLPMTVLIAGVIEIISLYVIVSKWKDLPAAGFIFFPLVAADTITVLFGMLSLASKLVGASRETKWSLEKYSPRDRWFKRFLRSCPPQKVGFGGSNFISETTPLIINQFCVSQAVSLMLLDR